MIDATGPKHSVLKMLMASDLRCHPPPHRIIPQAGRKEEVWWSSGAAFIGRCTIASGKTDWAKERYLSSNWDVNELSQMRERIIEDDLPVNRLRITA